MSEETPSPSVSLFLFPAVILLIGMLMTAAIWQIVRKQEDEKFNIEFDLLVEQTAEAIQDRIRANEQILRGVVGLSSANRQSGKSVTRAEFRAFVATLNLDERYPGIQGVGFSKLIQPGELAKHITAVRAEGHPDYVVRPAGERKMYSSILYLEPFDWRNQRAFGFDMYSEPVRRLAMERAWKTGTAALSGRVTLVQETDKEVQSGVLLYVPIYRGGITPPTLGERTDELVGWAYSPLRMKDMMSRLVEHDLKNIAGRLSFSIHDGEQPRAENLLYSTEAANAEMQSRLRTSRTLMIAGQSWLLTASSLPGLGSTSSGANAKAVLAAGLLISLLLAAISMVLQRGRARDALMLEKLAENEQRFRSYFHLPLAGLAVTSPAKGWIDVNEHLCEMLGYSREELAARTWAEMTHPDDLAADVVQFEHVLRGEIDGYSLDKRFIRKDGTPVHVALSVRCARNEDGTVNYFIALLHDISDRHRIEQKLRDREQHFRTLADSGVALIWTSGLDKLCDYFNAPWLRFTGRTLEQELGNGWAEGVHPEDFERCLQTYQTAFEQRHAFTMDYRLRNASGEYRWIRDDGVPRYDADGTFIGYIGYCLDIHQAKNMAVELEAHRSHLERLVAERTEEVSRQKFFLEDLIATLPCGVYRLRHKVPATAAEWADVEHPPHVQDLSSDTYCRLLGISREEAEATQGGVIARIHPDDLGEFLQRVEASNTALTPFSWEGRMRINGETQWMRFDAIPRRLGDETVVSGIVQNIDERMRQSSLIYRSVVEASPDAFVAIDESSQIIEWSAQAEKIFGYSGDEAVGMRLKDTIIPASQAAEHEFHLKKFASAGHDGAIGKRRRVIARRRNGSEFPVEMQIMALQLDGHWRFTSFLRDITDVLASEQRLMQAQKMEAIGQLTGGLAHDFNNLLGIIAGNIDLLQEGVSPEEQKELIDAALKAANRGVDVTKSLLAVARRDAPDPVPCNVNALLIELEPLLRQTAGRRITLSLSPHAEQDRVFIDSSAFSNALINLVINSRDATPGTGELLIYSYSTFLELKLTDGLSRSDLPEGLYAVVGVDDSGCGMDAKTARQACEPFFTTKKRGKGTGLGLAMARAFVEQFGGTLRIESNPGAGTSVQMILPVHTGDAPPNPPAPLPVSRDELARQGRILLVDDEADLLKISARWLRDLGYEVVTADSAASARDALSERTFDLLLTDIVMPGDMDGLALARFAADRYPRLKVVLTSGYPENIHADDRQRWVLVEKPATRTSLADAVRIAMAAQADLRAD